MAYKTMKLKKYQSIDLIIVNFYPFEKMIEQTKIHSKIIENIDVGGPTMVRAAAKNYNDVTVITSVDHYSELINELKNMCQGIHLMALGWESLIPNILKETEIKSNL